MKRVVWLALVVSFVSINQAFGWHFKVLNWSNAVQDVEGVYPGCRNNRTLIGIGHEAMFNAQGCLLTEIKLHKTSQIPYKSPGQSVDKEFFVVGPVDGEYLVGRFADR